ncbi:MAG: P-loop ATPase, Sll1717 family [Stellaceae bacterium]
MNKLSILKQISFGERVAEEETAQLANYFVETDQWSRILRGEVDVIRGDKGAGKSAIYSLLITKTDELFDRHILLVPAETLRGAPVFKDLVSDPPTTENEFINLWKLYILTLIAQKLREYDIRGSTVETVFSTLEKANLLEREFSLPGVFRAIREYVRRWSRIDGVEGRFGLDEKNLPEISGRITFREPNQEERKVGFISVDSLVEQANSVLITAGYHVWVILDRLDVAFADSADLERNALRALFRVYRDFSDKQNIELKIFLRTDIWNRITEGGFREASHIIKDAELKWDKPSLLNLIIRRLLSNDILANQYNINKVEILKDFHVQEKTFYNFFPEQVDQGSKKPSALDWMLSRTTDASGRTAPREVIHLLSSIRETEIRRLERGETQAPGSHLFERSTFKQALPAVSQARLVQNLYAEYPDIVPFVQALTNGKTEQTVESLATAWFTNVPTAIEKAEKLVDLGFFEKRGSREQHTFWIPFLFRDALHLVQGLAEEE